MGYDCGDKFGGNSLVQNGKENCHHEHDDISFNVKGIGSIVFSM